MDFYPITDYWSQYFTSSTFAHCTSTPIFWFDGEVHVRNPGGVHIFSRGKLGPSTGKLPYHSTRQRCIREGVGFYLKYRDLVVMGPKMQSQVD